MPDARAHPMELVKITLVPVEVFGTDGCGDCDHCEEHDGYGLCDAVSSWSDCNRAYGHIYRRDEEWSTRDPDDVITVFVPQSESPKFDKHYGDSDDNDKLQAERDELRREIDELRGDLHRAANAQCGCLGGMISHYDRGSVH